MIITGLQTARTEPHDIDCLRMLDQSGQVADLALVSAPFELPELSTHIRFHADNPLGERRPTTHPNIVVSSSRGQSSFPMKFKMYRVDGSVLVMKVHDQRYGPHREPANAESASSALGLSSSIK